MSPVLMLGSIRGIAERLRTAWIFTHIGFLACMRPEIEKKAYMSEAENILPYLITTAPVDMAEIQAGSLVLKWRSIPAKGHIWLKQTI